MTNNKFDNDIFTQKQNNIINMFIAKLEHGISEYDYIILTARRCFCLYNALVMSGVVSDSEKIISSQAIDIKSKDFYGKKILLCDDVMIHGNAIMLIYNKIKSYFPKEVDVLVMIRNIEKPDYFKISTGKDYESIVKLGDEDWRKFSNNMVKFIHSQGTLYVSYVYGFKMNSNKFDTLLNDVTGIEFLELEKDIFVENYYLDYDYEPRYFLINDKNKICNNEFINFVVLRVYRDPKEYDFVWVVPYVEFKDLECNSLNDVFKCLGNKCTDLKFNSSKIQFKALTAIFSILFYKTFFGVDNFIEFSEYINKSFSNDFVSAVINNLKLEEFIDICSKKLSICQTTSDIDYTDNIIFETLSDLDKYEVLDDYKKLISSISVKEEEAFFKFVYMPLSEDKEVDYDYARNKILPIRAKSFYEKICKDSTPSMNTIKYLLYFSDSGVISFIVDDFSLEDTKYVGIKIKAGEQSYRLHIDYMREYFKSIYFVYSLLLFYDKEKRELLIQKFLCILKSKYSKCIDIEKFEIYLTNNISKFTNYYFASISDNIKIDENEENRIFEITCDVLQLVENDE